MIVLDFDIDDMNRSIQFAVAREEICERAEKM